MTKTSKSVWDLVLVLALFAIVVAAWLAFLKPKPAPPSSANTRSSAKKIDGAAQDVEKEAAAAEALISAKTWDATPDTIGSKILDLLGGLASDKHVQLTDLRTERSISAPGLREAPYTVVLEGAFTDIVSVLNSLEDSDSKLAVSQVSVTSNNSGRVTATFAITGFLKREGG
jgi:hypothetical protein